jgi:starch synthase
VQQFDPATGRGTGVLFGDYTSEAAHHALTHALELYPNKGLWRRLVQNGMAQDFSWSRQVERYVEVYERLLT